MMEEYEKECKKRQARAEKFGTNYVAPKLEDYLPWTELKRLKDQSSISAGFATGIDLLDSEEIAKQEARKARFLAANKNNHTHNNDESDQFHSAGTATSDSERAESSIIAEPPSSPPPHDLEETNIDLPVMQCWDKEEMLRPQRTDPPAILWLTPNDESIPPPPPSSSNETTTTLTTEDQPSWVREKIHLFAIDWAAFKQIRNKDLLAFFTGYGPTYVEWLGDLSCNVCFGDQYTAKRALMTLGQEIPSPPPPEQALRQQDSLDNESKESEGTLSTTVPDLGNMHWRFCRQPVRKIANDKYGRKGTIARVLMRFALSTDILHDRPNAWPAPPGGFSSTKVLGPESDFKARKKSAKAKRQREKKKSSSTNTQLEQNASSIITGEDGEHPLLTRGLSAGRAGFSVEEMEEERAKKRSKTSESTNGNDTT